MAGRTKATESETEATEKTSVAEQTLDTKDQRIKELEALLVARDKRIEQLEKREEGYLVLTPNPQYDGITAGIQFTDGCAFIPKNRVIKRFEKPMPTESQMHAEANELNKRDHITTYEMVKERYEKAAGIPSSERAVQILKNDFGYSVEFYDKEKMDQLKDRISQRAIERAEAERVFGTEREQLEKMLQAHHL